MLITFLFYLCIPQFTLQIRWVVESANARIKQWKYLSYILPSSQIPFIGDYVRIALMGKCLNKIQFLQVFETPCQWEC